MPFPAAWEWGSQAPRWEMLGGECRHGDQRRGTGQDFRPLAGGQSRARQRGVSEQGMAPAPWRELWSARPGAGGAVQLVTSLP